MGDTLVVEAGQMIPVDGVITQGEASIDQHRLTGESQPAEKSYGDSVLAATVVLNGRVQIQVEKTGEATLAAQIGDILANTLDYHLSICERGKAIADRWVMPSLLMTGLAGVTLGPQSAIAVLSNMPAIDMMLLGPMTLLNYLNLASRQQVLIKDGRSLELLHKVNTVLFDKTGTLTLEQPQVKTVHPAGKGTLNENTVLTYAAAAEQRQSYSIVKVILAAAAERDLTLPTIDDAHYELGYGLCVWLVEDEARFLIRVGSKRFMKIEQVSIPAEIMAIQSDCHEVAHCLVMVAMGEKLVGAIELQPTIRPKALAVIEALHERKLTTACPLFRNTAKVAHTLQYVRLSFVVQFKLPSACTLKRTQRTYALYV